MIEENFTQDHDDIELLLPWYVNESLDTRDHGRVAGHISVCAECRQSVALLTEVQDAVLRNKSTPIVPRPRINDLVDAIESRESYRRLYGRRPRTLIAA
ncbi:MAG: hypothetical protein L0Y45_02235, partial [Woeseiaceae bacterium]|nr:hypothetical protein [Woeseiaceae bacterium]